MKIISDYFVVTCHEYLSSMFHTPVKVNNCCMCIMKGENFYKGS